MTSGHADRPRRNLIRGETTAPDWARQENFPEALNISAMWTSLVFVARLSFRVAPRLAACVFATDVVAALAMSVGLLSTASALGELFAAGPTPQRVVQALPAIGLVVGSAVARGTLSWLSMTLRASLRPLVECTASVELHERVSQVELAAFDDAGFRDLTDNATSRAVLVIGRAVPLTFAIAGNLASLVVAIATAALLNPWLASIVLLEVVPRAWFNARSARSGHRAFLKRVARERRRVVLGGLLTAREPAAELRAFGLRDPLLAEYRTVAEDIAADTARAERHQLRIDGAGRFVSGMGLGAAYLLMGFLLYIGEVPLALAGAAVITTGLVAQSLGAVMSSLTRVHEDSLLVEIYRRSLTESEARAERLATRTVPPPERVSFSDVTFTYPQSESPALTGLSVDLVAGTTTAVVGPNGSGKTTFARLLAGLYAPTSGSITWDGCDVRAWGRKALARHVSTVSQAPVRWPMTARDNVRVGDLSVPDEDGGRVADALRGSGAGEVVAQLPRGGETILSTAFEGGQDLSGGQWQRFGIARAMYRDARILIADEPSSSLDAQTEEAVYRSLRAAASGHRIVVLVSHRLASVRTADQIVVIDQGRVVEVGSHDDLMAADGLYARMYTTQARPYQAPVRD